MFIVTINGTSIPSKDVKPNGVKTTEFSLEFAGSKLISSQTTIELNNSSFTYDDRQLTGGMFEGQSWYNWTVTVFDDETDEYIWEGRLKKHEIDDTKRVVILTVNDYVQEMVDAVCVINLLNVTVAEAVYAILTDSEYLQIPEERLIKSGFQIGQSQQQSCKINIAFTLSNGKKCISVIEELLRISGSHVFQRENKIGYWFWQPYAGVLGSPVYVKDILPGSFNQKTEDEKIYNSFSLSYNNSGTVGYSTYENTVSAAKYGSGRLFSMPEDENESTSSSAFNILFVSKAAADYMITLLDARYSNIKKICSFTGKKSLGYLNLGETVDMRFLPFTREPVTITGIKPSREKRELEFTAELCNYPEVVTLDLVAPDAVYLFEGICFAGKILLRWTKSTASDLLQYKLYFSTSENYWGNELGPGRFSPLTIPEGQIEYVDCDCIYEFTPETGKTYWFRVSAVDTSYNEGEYSNVIEVSVPTSEADYENIYNLTGDPLSGFTLDMDNPYEGEGLEEWAAFDEAEFDVDVFAPTAVYESPLLRRSSGFEYLKYIAYGDPGDIQLQVRSYDGAFGPWSDAVNAAPLGVLGLTGEYMQYRVIFNSPQWTDADKFIVKEII